VIAAIPRTAISAAQSPRARRGLRRRTGGGPSGTGAAGLSGGPAARGTPAAAGAGGIITTGAGAAAAGGNGSVSASGSEGAGSEAGARALSAAGPKASTGLVPGPVMGAVRTAAVSCSRTSCSIRSASAALRRVPGSLRSKPLITGSSGPACSGGSGSSETTAVRPASTPGRSKGGFPSTAEYSEAPSPHRSAAASARSPRARSGAR
jgi:hypothetical protein